MNGFSTRELTYAALSTALIGAAAFIAIPLGPVPFTMQPLVVLLTGLVLGARLGALSVIAYLVLGLIAPVYAGGTTGLGVLLGPTGGYLLGFVLAALVAGAVAHSGTIGIARFAFAGVLALLPIYVLGAAWLAVSLHLGDLTTVLATGVLPFLPFDVVKAVVASVAAYSLCQSPLGRLAMSRDA